MSLTTFEIKRSLSSWATSVLELIQKHDYQAAERIRLAIDQFASQRFTLTVLGKAKRGKSTLVNALLGRNDDTVAPIDKLPASSVISRISRADLETAAVHFRADDDRRLSRSSETIPFTGIREYVTDEGNPDNLKQVELVEIRGPFKNLDSDLILVDTPGAGSTHQYHDEILHAYIPQSDAVIFLVTARMPIDADELELLRKITASDIRKVVFAINKVDASTIEDTEAAIQHNRRVLTEAGIPVETIHLISAKQAFEGNIAASGLDSLAAEIQTIMKTGKADLLAERFQARVIEIARPFLQGLLAETALMNSTQAELAEHQRTLTANREQLQSGRHALERQFQVRWEAAIHEFANRLPQAREGVKSDILDYLQSRSSLAMGKAAKEMPTTLSRGIEEHLRPIAEDLERELQSACQELQAGYVELNLHIPEMLGIRTRGDGTFLKGAASASMTAVAGAGLVTAANAAAIGSVTYLTTPTVVGGILTQLIGTTGGFVTTTALPAAAPAWVLMAGPIGWTLGGIGLLALPFAWSLAKSRQKTKLEDECVKQIDEVFRFLKEERTPALRASGLGAIEEFRINSERELAELEAALIRASQKTLTGEERRERTALADHCQKLLSSPLGIAHDDA